MNRLKVQNSILWVTVIVLGVVAVVSGAVMAYDGGSVQNLTENGDINVINNYGNGVGQGDSGMIGAAVASEASHLSQEPKPTALSYLYLSNDFEVDGTAYFDGTVYAYNGLTVATDEIMYHGSLGTIVTSGTVADATSTLFCVQNPFSATSTVDLVELIVTGASTSTFDFSTPTSTTSHPTTIYGATFLSPSVTTTPSLVNGALFVTSTLSNVMSNVAAYSTPAGMILPNRTATNVRAIMVDPNDYICGVATNYDGLGSVEGLINPSNTFVATYYIRWIR